MKSLKNFISIFLCCILMLNNNIIVYSATNIKEADIVSYFNGKVNSDYPSGKCLAFVADGFRDLGATRSSTCCAYKYGNSYIDSTSSENIPIGADVFFGKCGGGPCEDCGATYYGHIGVYVGDGYFVHATGGKVHRTLLSDWSSKYRGWGYHGNVNVVYQTQNPVDLGTNFYAVILNTGHWKPITLDDDGFVRLRTEVGKGNQVWKFIRQEDGSYVILSALNGKALEMYCGDTTPSNPVAAVSDDWGGNYQRWYIYGSGNGYVLLSKHFTEKNLVLDLTDNKSEDGTPIITYTRHDGAPQIWSIYKENEVQIKGPTLSVTTGTSATNTKFTWNEVYGENRYDVKIWKNKLYEGDAYHIEWGAKSGYGIKLPAGTYQAYVDAANYFECKMGNTVTFTVPKATYTVKYDANGGTGAPANQTKTEGVALTLSTTKPDMEYHTFRGWATSKTATTAEYQPGGSYTKDADVTLYAVWKHNCADGHKYSYKVSASPTTTSSGKLAGTCSVCTGTTSVTLPKLNTTDYTYKVVKEAGCETSGTGRYTWKTTTYGTYSFDVTISKKGHSYKSSVVAATCTAQGYTLYTCSNCGNTYKDTYKDPTGHKYTYKTTTNPTVSTSGVLSGTCSVCSGTTTVSLPKLNTTDYNYTVVKKATCTADGIGKYTWKTTTYGNYSFETTISKEGHDYKDTVIDPSCTADGYTSHSCSKCGDSFEDSIVAMLGHDYQNGSCSRCGEKDPNALVQNPCGDNVFWELSDEGILTISGSGLMTNYTYKSEMPWYRDADKIRAIVIEDGVGSIGDYAFYGMPVLKDISIPETVTYIGEYAFKNAAALEKVQLPSGLTKLGESAFYACTSLTSIEIPAGLWTVQPYTFKNCTSLAEVTFHEGNLQKISDGAFYNTALKEVTLPDCLDILDSYTFKNCVCLSRITLGNELTDIREAVFYGTAIKEITIPEGIRKIGPYAFKNCTALENIYFPESLTSVGEASFYACTGLDGVSLPDAVTTIGDYAFRKCTGLTSVDFGTGLTSIGECAFYGCTGLTELKLAQSDGLKTIKPYAFKGCTGITIVSLPESLQTMGDSAFHTCTGLKTMVIPAKVTTIGEYCFSGCYDLYQITFMGGAPVIGTGAFKGMKATVSYLSSNGGWTEDVLQNYGGTITWKNEEDTEYELTASGECGANVTWTLRENGELKISGIGGMDDYAYNTTPWYSYRDSITSVTIGEGVSRIGTYAFYYCENLQDVKMTESVQEIGDNAFSGCSGIAGLVIPNGVIKIGAYCFSNCTSLVDLTLGNKLENIGAQAFASCAIKKIELPDSVKILDVCAFDNCKTLSEIELGKVESIGTYAFRNCSSLKNVVVPETTTFIGELAFDVGGWTLEHIYILNPECEIEMAYKTLGWTGPSGTVIHGYTESSAQVYAERHGAIFEEISE